MTRRVILRPAAEADIDAAAAWLEERSPRSAARFWRGVEETLQRLQEKARRALLRDFRYALFYVVIDNDIVVVACMHGSRHPKRWQERIPE